MKKFSCMVLALLMLVTVFSVPTTASAAEKESVPQKVRIYSGSYDNYAISFDYDNSGDQIKNLKTSSKNLVARQTRQESSSEDSYGSDNSATIGLYAKKEGKYTVSFDIYSKDGSTKRSSQKVTVYAKNDSPIKSIKLDGKNIWEEQYTSAFTTKKSGKLSISMAKGYTLKKIQIRTYDKNGKEVVKTVKNNKKITLGQYSYSYTYSYESEYSSYWRSYWYKYLNAPTYIEITYKDKWTKQNEVITYSIQRLSK